MNPLLSIVVVSFNTRDLLRECLTSLDETSRGIAREVFVVDNLSGDDSAGMVHREFPWAKLIRCDTNLGFAAANNAAFRIATGRYIVLLNSDAFLQAGALKRAAEHMEDDPQIGIGGARLIGRDGSWQPSARLFPSPLNEFLTISGLAGRHSSSRFFGRFDRTWASPEEAADVDWVPGAFSMIRREALETVGYFDESFFLYYEEVDLCRRFKQAGYRVRYWPDVVVVHYGGESSKTVKGLKLSTIGSQLSLWRMRSAFLYYRKHHGGWAWIAKELERNWHRLRAWKNHAAKRDDSSVIVSLLDTAWRETAGGRVSPTRPW